MKARAIPFFSVLILAAPAVAQSDTIYLTDGTKKERVRITAYDFLKIEFRQGSNTDSIPREKVLRIVPGQRALDKHFRKAQRYLGLAFGEPRIGEPAGGCVDLGLNNHDVRCHRAGDMPSGDAVGFVGAHRPCGDRDRHDRRVVEREQRLRDRGFSRPRRRRQHE